ncbi:MAG: hypothetical protein AB8H86_26655 [Polyangiales bacterium]
MKTVAKYDDSTWHSGGEFPADKPARNGGTHIALFLRWCMLRGLVAERHRSKPAAQLAASGGASAVDYLFDECDGCILPEDLSARGNRFAQSYYRALYDHDWVDVYDMPLYGDEQDHDFFLLVARLDQRLLEADCGRLPALKRRRRFWRRD